MGKCGFDVSINLNHKYVIEAFGKMIKCIIFQMLTQQFLKQKRYLELTLLEAISETDRCVCIVSS